MGTWEQLTAARWVYRIAGQPRPAGYALQERPNGATHPIWEAVVPSRPISTAIVACHVPLAQAKAAVEDVVQD